MSGFCIINIHNGASNSFLPIVSEPDRATIFSIAVAHISTFNYIEIYDLKKSSFTAIMVVLFNK